MKRPSLLMVDDAVARAWRPFTLTRPAGELLFGTRTLRQRAEEALGSTCMGHVTSPSLRDFDEPWAPGVVELQDIDAGKDVVYLLSRFVAEPVRLPDEPALLVSEGQVVGVRPATHDAPPDLAFFDDPETHTPNLPQHEVPGRLLRNVWDLMAGNAEQLSRDLGGLQDSRLPSSVHRLGDAPISVSDDVRLAPGVVLDSSAGPIRIERGVDVRPFTALAGPAHIGPGTSLLGGSLTAVTIGPHCKVHGEVEETVFLGYSNKAHDGFLGHAYVGMWVNLGALTTNSDLKNNYGVVRLWTPAGDANTGQNKVGCFLGDHVKTAIGTMINTGTVVEAGANVFGGMPPKYVPPFAWGPDSVYEPDRFLDTASTVMARRDVPLSDRQRRLLRTAVETAS